MSRFADRPGRFVAVGAVLALVLGAGITPSLADPVPGSPVGVGPVRTTSRDSFTVPVWTDATGATVDHVSVALRHDDDTVPITLAKDQNGAWATPAVLELVDDGGTMPDLGQYAIDVTATDDQGNTTTRTDAGTLDFTLTPVFDGPGPLTFTPATISLAAHQTAVSGSLQGRRPGSNKLVPLPHEWVSVAENASATQPSPQVVETGTDGTFSTTTFDAGDTAFFSATANVDEPYADGRAATSTIAPLVTREPMYVTASSSPALVASGQHYVVRGVVRSGSTASAAGVASVAITVNSSNYGAPGPRCTTSTDANGAFACTMTAYANNFTDYWTVSASAPFRYTVGADQSGTIDVADDSAYRGVRISLASNGTVTATGDLVAPYDPYTDLYSPDTRLEYSANGRTGWTLMNRTRAPYQGSPFTVTGAARLTNAYYRVHHVLSSTLAEAVSPVVHLARTDTRIVGNDATPEPIKAGRTIAVAGILQQYVKGWRPAPGQVVDLYFYVRGAKTYSYVTAGRTDAHGHIVLHAKATKDGYWELHYFGDAAHFDGYSTADYVDVR